MAQNLCRFDFAAPKPRMGRLLGYIAQNLILRAPSPPASPDSLWFPGRIGLGGGHINRWEVETL